MPSFLSVRPLSLLMLSALIATGIAGRTPARAAGTLTLAQSQDPGSWDPVDTFLISWGQVATNIFDGLTARGPDLKLVPGLAESWDVAPTASASASSCGTASRSRTASRSTRRR